MRTIATLAFDNSYARLHPSLYEVIDPTPLANTPRLVAFSPPAAALIDLDTDAASAPELLAAMTNAWRIPGSEPIATLYAGHQFGLWVPELGDGRAILLGEVRNRRGEAWELQLKGAGQTRYSRGGDGRSVLRSAIREFLASEALAGLGLPTTRALAVAGTDDPVQRETVETAATLIRLAPTHVRFGTFEVLAARGALERVRELADYVIARHYPEAATGPEPYAAFLDAVVERTAALVADWMAVGFTHGVLNTDNMSIVGVTLDYGPYGFVDEFDPSFTPNHSDPDGRYAYDRQPAIGIWNLLRFAESLLSLVPAERANASLERYPPAFEARYGGAMRAKLGLATSRPEDGALIGDLLELLAANRVDYTRFFRALTTVAGGDRIAPPALESLVGDRAALDAWVARYGERLEGEEYGDESRRAAMSSVNPKYVLRNYLAQEAIDRARAGDFGEIERLRSVLADPFAEHPEHERYAGPTPAWARDLVVSCSS
jgi:protein adenylyltransferase